MSKFIDHTPVRSDLPNLSREKAAELQFISLSSIEPHSINSKILNDMFSPSLGSQEFRTVVWIVNNGNPEQFLDPLILLLRKKK